MSDERCRVCMDTGIVHGTVACRCSDAAWSPARIRARAGLRCVDQHGIVSGADCRLCGVGVIVNMGDPNEKRDDACGFCGCRGILYGV